MPFMAVDAWFGLFAPRGTDAARVTHLAEAFLGALSQPETATRATQAGLTAAPMPPAEFAAFQAADEDSPIAMKHLVRAVANEYGRQGRLTLEADFGMFHEVIKVGACANGS